MWARALRLHSSVHFPAVIGLTIEILDIKASVRVQGRPTIGYQVDYGNPRRITYRYGACLIRNSIPDDITNQYRGIVSPTDHISIE